ncbi:MAG: translesion DNA synthesis-associated protein ImuA [Panacagrimonas sp.]
MNSDLCRLSLGTSVWRASQQAAVRAEPTGHAELDRVLPGGGWPIGAVSEVLYARHGVGELSLTLPLLARLTQSARPVALVFPPMLPYAPRLAVSGLQLDRVLIVDSDPQQGRDRDAESNDLWVAEQLLRAGAGAVLLWIEKAQAQSLRRLQLAAESGDGCVLLLRPEKFAAESTPSALRLRVWRERGGAPCVEVLKCRGARPAPVQIMRVAA